MNKHCVIDFSKCSPDYHDPVLGSCLAASACTRKLIEQEEPFQPPMLISMMMCTGCGLCVAACPMRAVSVGRY